MTTAKGKPAAGKPAPAGKKSIASALARKPSRKVAKDMLVLELRRLNQDLAIPSPKAHGIDPARWSELLPTMASQAVASGSPANNPRVPEPAEIVELYRQVFA